MTIFDSPVAVFGAVYEGDPEGDKHRGPLIHDTIYPPMRLVAEHFNMPVHKIRNELRKHGFMVFRHKRDFTVVMNTYLHELNRSGSVH